jgi:hypothetical protein
MADDTVSDNSATQFGGGILNMAPQGGTISLENSIVADDTSLISPQDADLSDDGDLGGGRLTGSDDLIRAGDTGSLTLMISGLDPRLGPLRDNGGPTWTQALLPGSPAIQAGDPSLVPAGETTDQRGFGYARVVRGQLDLGAFEIQAGHLRPPVARPLGSGPPAPALVGLTIVPPRPSPGVGSSDGTAATATGGP